MVNIILWWKRNKAVAYAASLSKTICETFNDRSLFQQTVARNSGLFSSFALSQTDDIILLPKSR